MDNAGQPHSIDALFRTTPVIPLRPSAPEMPPAPPAATPPAATAIAATRPGALRSTGFGMEHKLPELPYALDALAPSTPRPEAAAAGFDVCHVVVVLRALLFVHGVLAIGALFAAASWQAWSIAFTLGASSALPAVLIWLLVLCAIKRPLVRWSLPLQWSVAIGLGGLCGAAGSMLAWLPLAGTTTIPAWLAPAAAGAALAAALFQWLRLRAQASLPAETAARLAELQSRIRPHFLFNTLNSALALVRHDPQRAEAVLEDLAELFRVALTESGDSVTLNDEVDLAQRYLAIEQIRFGERMAVSWDLDPATRDARVPALLLQPLIENAVRHGIESADGGGTIHVQTRTKGGHAVISVRNSVPATASRPGLGMALHNVQERLRLLHDVNAQFESRRDADGFHVRIMVPL